MQVTYFKSESYSWLILKHKHSNSRMHEKSHQDVEWNDYRRTAEYNEVDVK